MLSGTERGMDKRGKSSEQEEEEERRRRKEGEEEVKRLQLSCMGC